MKGNVAYINNDFLSTAAPRPKTQASAKAKALPDRKTTAAAHQKANAAARPKNTAAKPKTAAAAKSQANTAARPVCKKAAGKGIASTLFVVFVAFCALSLLVSRHANIAMIGIQNNALQKDIQQIEAQIEDLKLELELRSTLESVQDKARQELGMTYPTQNEKVHIDLNGR